MNNVQYRVTLRCSLALNKVHRVNVWKDELRNIQFLCPNVPGGKTIGLLIAYLSVETLYIWSSFLSDTGSI